MPERVPRTMPGTHSRKSARACARTRGWQGREKARMSLPIKGSLVTTPRNQGGARFIPPLKSREFSAPTPRRSSEGPADLNSQKSPSLQRRIPRLILIAAFLAGGLVAGGPDGRASAWDSQALWECSQIPQPQVPGSNPHYLLRCCIGQDGP